MGGGRPRRRPRRLRGPVLSAVDVVVVPALCTTSVTTARWCSLTSALPLVTLLGTASSVTRLTTFGFAAIADGAVLPSPSSSNF